jgi:hypothetical protein
MEASRERDRKVASSKLRMERNGTKEGTKVMETKPTYEQAQLHLQIYDVRREDRLRQARDWFFKNYFVDTLADAMRLAAPGTETGATMFGFRS